QIDAILSSADLPWRFFRSYYTTNASELNTIGVTHGPAGFTLSSSAYNLFGLQYESLLTAYRTNSSVRLTTNTAGGTVPDTVNILYPATAQPDLRTVGYYFAVPYVDPLPGDDVFSPTNTTPLLFAPVGQPLWLAAYAKQAISNGVPTKFGYLGQ